MVVAFVDDSPDQIAAMRESCPNVKTIAVRGKTRKQRAITHLPASVELRKGSKAVIDVGAGIDQPAVDSILGVLKKKGDVALFDWGRTLAQVKGVNLDNAKSESEQMDILTWAVGGPARLIMLQNMFAELRQRHVQIVILSNSPTCKRDGWRDLLRKLIGGNITWMCGHGHKGRRLSRRAPRLCSSA